MDSGMNSEAVCIGGVLDGRRKRWMGRQLVATKPFPPMPVSVDDEPLRIMRTEQDIYRLEIIAIADEENVEQIPLWVVEGMTRNEALAHVIHAYGARALA